MRRFSLQESSLPSSRQGMAPSATIIDENLDLRVASQIKVSFTGELIAIANSHGANPLIEHALRLRVTEIDADTCDVGSERCLLRSRSRRNLSTASAMEAQSGPSPTPLWYVSILAANRIMLETDRPRPLNAMRIPRSLNSSSDSALDSTAPPKLR